MQQNIYQNEITYDKENDKLEIRTCYTRDQYKEYMKHIFLIYLQYRTMSKDSIFEKNKFGLALRLHRLLALSAFILSTHILYQEYQFFNSLNIISVLIFILTGIFTFFPSKSFQSFARIFVNSPLFYYQRHMRPELREMSLYYSKFPLFTQRVIISRESCSCNYSRSCEIFISESNQTEYRILQRDNGVYFFRFVSVSPLKKQINWKSSFALIKSQYSEKEWQILVQYLAQMHDLC